MSKPDDGFEKATRGAMSAGGSLHQSERTT